MVGTGEKIVNVKAPRLLENAILRLDLKNPVCHKRDILLIFEAGITESVLHINSYP